MLILSEIVDVFDDLAQLEYEHNLSISHIMGGVSNYISLFVKSPFLIMKMNGYVSLNEQREIKDYMDPF